METKDRISVGARWSFLPQEVIMLTANANYAQVYLSGGKVITVATTLKTLESRFAICTSFFRTHKSYLINIDFIRKCESSRAETFVQMKNGYRAEVSRRKRGAFNRRIRTLAK